MMKELTTQTREIRPSIFEKALFDWYSMTDTNNRKKPITFKPSPRL